MSSLTPERLAGKSEQEVAALELNAGNRRLRVADLFNVYNHEGQFVDWCHDARRWAGGLVVNPGAWTHYSYAIRDALELWRAPVVEVHLSNIEEREEWRRRSVIGDVVAHRILGKGPEGYREALVYLKEHG